MNLLKYLFILSLVHISNSIISLEKNAVIPNNLMESKNIALTIHAWQEFLTTTNWQDLILNIVPKETGCGLIYELADHPCQVAHESFAIADMRNIRYSEPHYHPHEIEIYFVLQGNALIVIADEEIYATKGDVIVTEPNKAHYVIPDKDFVIAVINMPDFNPANYIPLVDTNKMVGFDLKVFTKLIEKL
jgi:mannose-6-phosphate isomerase-like protein (cupin superfamily)